MKKLIAFIIIAGLLLTGTVAYAEEAADDTQAKNGYKRFLNDIKPQLETIKENREQIKKLREEAIALYKETKQMVKELFKSQDEISQAQIEAIKEAIDVLVSDKKLLVQTKGDIFKGSIDLRAARKNKDYDAHKAALANIITVQNERIDTLNKVLEDLKAINII